MRCLLAILFVLFAVGPSVARQSGVNPHGQLPAPLDCSSCHKAANWTDLREEMEIDHGELTGFVLGSAHETPSCISCHTDARFDLPESSDCATCHEDVRAGALSENCVDCHNTTRFDDVDGISAHMRTTFALTGSHVQVPCSACHTDDHAGFLSPLQPECESCHLDEYEATQSIDHVENGFFQICQDCHGTIAWSGGWLFDHLTASGFELLGAHDRIACTNCHGAPNLVLIVPQAAASDCFTCHESDYDANHRNSDFPTDCLQCHTAERWDDAGFPDHDAVAFPIYSGEHRGEWNTCQTCHDSGGFETFTCFNCHEHAQSEMDDEHRGTSGYVYESLACLSCHPDGKEDD